MNFDPAYGQNVGSTLIDHRIVCATFAKPLNSSTQTKKEKENEHTHFSFLLILFLKNILSILTVFLTDTISA